jgi:hypothetical protein
VFLNYNFDDFDGQCAGSLVTTQLSSKMSKAEPVQGPSIEQLEKGQKKIVKLMEKSQSSYLKIHQAV